MSASRPAASTGLCCLSARTEPQCMTGTHNLLVAEALSQQYERGYYRNRLQITPLSSHTSATVFAVRGLSVELVLLSGQQCDGDDGISCHFGHPAGPGQVKHLTCPSHPTPTTTLGGMDSYCHLTAKEMKLGVLSPSQG